jgi:hypothetical protein
MAIFLSTHEFGSEKVIWILNLTRLTYLFRFLIDFIQTEFIDNYKLSHGQQLCAKMTIFYNYVLQWWKFRFLKNSSFFCDGNSNSSNDDA